MDPDSLFIRSWRRDHSFFNHWFKKRFNEEPSPLEVEIFNYQQDLQQYINTMENELNDPRNSS